MAARVVLEGECTAVLAPLDPPVQGIDVNARTRDGRTAYNIPQAGRNSEAVGLLVELGTSSEPQKFPALTGPYLGQAPPGSEPARFAPGIVVGHHSALSVSPDGQEIYGGARSASMTTRLENGRWGTPILLDPRLCGPMAIVSPDGQYVCPGGISWVSAAFIEERARETSSSPTKLSKGRGRCGLGRRLERRGVPAADEAADTPDPWAEQAPGLAGLTSASVQGRVGPRAAPRWAPASVWRHGAGLTGPVALGPCHARRDGFDLGPAVC